MNKWGFGNPIPSQAGPSAKSTRSLTGSGFLNLARVLVRTSFLLGCRAPGGAALPLPLLVLVLSVILKMYGFTPYSILAIFGPAVLKISGFYPTRFFLQFWADPIFPLLEALFWPKRRPQILIFDHTQNFGHFWAALLKMSGFTPTRNFGHFWASSLDTLLIFTKCH